ncbi:putative toxin-antitoxin system toxin component, PIN family [Parasediminibacterium sp. JCM 36343]|uniref:putative toxin-antitoxin system toxin component, PIN family n=1 Tax=Parasediminibacterium sp. JCM 36343 TaxID=3374279 RepID=UPI00397D4ADB
MNKRFVVVDTNCFISANLFENSNTALAFDKALRIGRIALSASILAEYTEVLYRKKLDKYLTETKRKAALRLLVKNAVIFNITETINDCRDPKDNMFLELAVACDAACIITGDNDLLVLNPFRGIPVINADDFLKKS